MKITKVQFVAPVSMPDGRYVDEADSRYDISLHESSIGLQADGRTRHYPLQHVAYWEAQAPQSAAGDLTPAPTPQPASKTQPRGPSKAK